MLFAHFTEMPYRALDPSLAYGSDAGDHPARIAGDSILLFSNRHYDPAAASAI